MSLFREISKTLFLTIASFNLGISSGLEWLGILFAIGFVYLGVRDVRHGNGYGLEGNGVISKNPRYRKSWAYGAIVPCAIWWVLTPGVDYGVSPWLIFIPGFYLCFLALIQKRSLGNGGYEAFVAFDGCAVLLCSFFQAGRPGVITGIVALFFALVTYSRPKTALWKHLLFILLFVGFGFSAYGGWQYWKNHRSYHGSWGRDYYEKNRVMGFDPVVSLGSFSSNYHSRYNGQVVVRVWDTLAPEYLKGAVYEKYVAGIWKLPPKPEKKLYPSRYNVDYAVFEIGDSLAVSEKSRAIWVQTAMDNFGFMFAAPSAVGVAAKNADSLDYYNTGIFTGVNGNRSDWYYFVLNDEFAGAESVGIGPAIMDTDLNFLHIAKPYEGLIDSIAVEMGLVSQNPDTTAFAIKQFFRNNFKYSLVVPGVHRHWHRHKEGSPKEEPLRHFWTAKEGYCEYYATLAVLLLRHQRIPARYVTGFARPERVAGRPYVQYRRHHSHAWVEVYARGEWLPFDPTPPIPAVSFKSPSWFQTKWEGIQGRFAFFFHFLKEGEWRRTVDDWQSVTQRTLESPFFYIGLFALVLGTILLKIRQNRKRRVAVPVKISNHAKEWIHKLDRAEKYFAKYGFVRESGETVLQFYERVEDKYNHGLLEEKNKYPTKFADELKALKAYNSNRWK